MTIAFFQPQLKTWKWILLFLSGIIVFLCIYAIGQQTESIFMLSLLPSVLLIAIYALWKRYLEKDNLKEISLKNCAPQLSVGFSIGLGYMLFVATIILLLGGLEILKIEIPTTDCINYLAFFLYIAIGEEILFRGIIFRYLDMKWNTVVALSVSALLFGLVHITNAGASIWSSIAIAIEAGLLLGAIYKYSNSLWVPIGVHWAWNFSEGYLFGSEVSGQSLTSCLIYSRPIGNELISGGNFGFEASIVATVVGLVLSIIYIKKAENKYRKKYIIWDLDGTLMNTLQDLANATNYALEQHGMPKRELSEIRQFVGNGIRNLISRSVVEGSNEEDIDKVLDSFKTYYAEHCKDNTNPYEGIIEILTELKEKGVHMAIVSNKIQSGVDNLHETWFKENISCAIGERENVLRKPAPDMVYIAMKELKANAEQCIYIGDSEIDVITAHNAGLPCICVLWGFRDKNILKKHYGKYFVSHPKEILDFIK